MPLKIVMFYNQGSAGWTETFYHPATTPPQFFAGVSGNLFAKAIACRAPATVLFACRASSVDAPRSSITKFFGNSYVVPPQAGPDKQPDIVGTDALVALNTSLGNNRKLYLRGLNDFNTLRSASFFSEPTALLNNGIQLYVNAMIAAQLQIRFGVRPPSGGLTWYPVISVRPWTSSTSQSLCVIQGLPVWAGNTQVLFEGVPKNDLPGFPRLANIVGPSTQDPLPADTDIYVNYRYRASTSIVYPSNMKVVLNTYQFSPIADWSFEAFTTHKVGRAFGVARGRARAAVKAR